MKNLKQTLLTGLLLLTFCASTLAQAPKRIVGYFAYYENTNRIQWDKITDLNYAFGRPENDGSITMQGWQFANIVTTANSNNVDVYIALGGANQSYGFNEIIKTQAAMDKFANEIKGLIDQYDLAGVDLDWEFPEANQGQGMLQMVKTIRNVIGNNKKISIAATPLSFNAAGLINELEPYIDYYNIMAYDDSDAANHSSMEFTKSAIEFWVNKETGKGVPREKLVLGVPFYGKGTAGDIFYRDIPDAFADVDTYGTYGFNGRVTIRDKADLTLEEGLNGIMIWEIAQDKLDQYSLLSVINDVYNGKSRCLLPNIGEDRSLCDVTSINLDAQISGNYSYSWTKDNNNFPGTSATNSVTEEGEYCVVVTDNSGSCLDKHACAVVRGVSDIEVKNGETCGTGTVDLNVVTAGDYEWFTAESGGSAVHAGSSFTTPTISTTQTYYIEKKTINGVIGESTNTTYGWFHDYTLAQNKQHYMKFDAKQDIIITEGTLFIGLVEGAATFTVYDSDTVTVIAEQTLNVLDIDENNNGKVVFNLELHIPQGENYFLSLRNSTNSRIFLDNQQPGGSKTYAYPYVLTDLFEAKSHIAPWGEDHFMYVGIYDIKVQSEPGCGRVPVEAKVNTGCILPTLDIIKPTNNQAYNEQNVDIEVNVNDADGTVVKVTASIISKTNFTTVATITLSGSNNVYTGMWIPTDLGEYFVEIEVTDNDGNKAKDQVTISIDAITGISQILDPQEFYLNADFSMLTVPEAGDFEIYSVAGTLIFNSSTYSKQINVAHLNSGIYIIRLNNKIGRFLKR